MGFSDIIGQRHALSLVRRAIETGRLPHALLFTGPKGVGRFLTAVTVAKAVNCQGGVRGDCCDECPACAKIAKGTHPDVHLVTPDGATLKIDQIRTLAKEAALRPYEGRRSVFILDDAETMTDQAQNALLKTLEEPPGATLLVLIAPEASALLPPIVSRCSQIRFAPLPEETIAARLQAQGHDQGEAYLLAGLAGGSLGRAQKLRTSALQELWDLVEQTADLSSGKTPPVLELAERVVRLKEMLPLFLDALVAWCRDLIVAKVTCQDALLVYRNHGSALKRHGDRLAPARLLAMYQTVRQTVDAINGYANPRLSLEVMFLRLRDLQSG